MNSFITGAIARVKEPSTWGGLSAIAIAITQSLPVTWQPYGYTLASAFGGAAVFLRERGTKPTDLAVLDAVTAAKQIEATKGAH